MAVTAALNAPAGKLFLVGTPIGNLEDITLRALQTLRSVDLIACEDTRRTQKLLNHYQIKTPTISYHEHNEVMRAPELILEMEDGSAVALVSDAGMPGLSDPGYRLVHLAIRHKIPVTPIPGVSSLVAALSAAGLPIDRFAFAGFLPSKKTARVKALEGWSNFNRTLVFFEAPHRVVEMLAAVLEVLGDRQMTLAREVTKAHEEFLRGTVSEVLAQLRKRAVKGEITLVIAPLGTGAVKPSPAQRSLREEIEQAIKEQGLDERAALKAVARARGVARSELYRQWVREKSLGS
jgi:16S rRNA (cytidine1402-2'-O)-methyltransferase